MKLRFNGNSIRLRVSKTDVDSILNQEDVIESVSFDGNGQSNFNYILKLSPEDSTIKAVLTSFEIIVIIPKVKALNWAKGDQVGLYHQQPSDKGNLAISIEKDFQCLHKRPGEDESDNFPNPNK